MLADFVSFDEKKCGGDDECSGHFEGFIKISK